MATGSITNGQACGSSADNRLLKFTGWDDEIYFMHLDDGHFYDIERRCASYKLFGITSLANTKASNCYVEPSGTHTHQRPSLTDVVIFTINWACKIEAIRYWKNKKMTDEKIISNVVSTWPCDLSALLPEIKSTCSSTIQKYRTMAKDPWPSDISSSKSQEEFTRFREVIVKLQPNWPQPTIIPDPVCPVDLANWNKFISMFKDFNLEISEEESFNNDVNIKKIVGIAKQNSIFYQRYSRWKQSELEIEQLITDGSNEAVVISKCLPNKSEIISQNPPITILVLRLPSLSDWSKQIFEKMGKLFNDLAKSRPLNSEDKESDDVPWHAIEKNRKQVLDKVRDLQSQWYRNQKNPSYEHVRFRIVFEDESFERNNFFSVYQNGLLQKKKMNQLPGSPTKFRISKAHSKSCEPGEICIRLDWEYECQEYLSQFVIQYRSKNSNSWVNFTAKKTCFKIRIFQREIYEFRVAAETCFGRGKFTDIDTELLSRNDQIQNEKDRGLVKRKQATEENVESQSTDSTPAEVPPAKKQKMVLQPPTDLEILLVTENMAKVKWTCVNNDLDPFYYHLQCWKKGAKNFTTEIDVDLNQSECIVNQLEPETNYYIRVRVISKDGQHNSLFSKIISLTILRFAENLVKKCKKIGKLNGIDIFDVPLIKSAESSSASKLERYTFGEQVHGKQRKTILLMDETGSACKTALINAMINYIFNVKIEDTFQFQLIQVGQKSHIKIYEINHAPGFNIPFSLTIIDTPNFETTSDDWMNDMTRLLVEDIKELDMVAIVDDIAKPSFDISQWKFFTIFGKDLEENIRIVLSRTDNVHVLPVVTDMHEAKLPFSTEKVQFFQDFLSSLAAMETKSLAMTKQVLQLRKRHLSNKEKIRTRTKTRDVIKLEMKKNEEIISECQARIDAHPYVTLEVDSAKKVQLPIGQLATNCISCCVTCCNPCRIKKETGLSSLELSNCCTFCQGKCAWAIHSNQPFKWEIVQEKQVFPSEVGKEKHFADMGRKQSAKQTLELLKNDLFENEKADRTHMKEMVLNFQQLYSISLCYTYSIVANP